jgi:hypothetical protein
LPYFNYPKGDPPACAGGSFRNILCSVYKYWRQTLTTRGSMILILLFLTQCYAGVISFFVSTSFSPPSSFSLASPIQTVNVTSLFNIQGLPSNITVSFSTVLCECATPTVMFAAQTSGVGNFNCLPNGIYFDCISSTTMPLGNSTIGFTVFVETIPNCACQCTSAPSLVVEYMGTSICASVCAEAWFANSTSYGLCPGTE